MSVVTPTYNRATILGDTIESVLNQSFSDLEIIVVDDGSTDGTGDQLRRRYSDKRIRYLYQENKGRSAARNLGLMSSSSPYVLFLDSDDMLLPHALDYEVSLLDDQPDVDIVYTDGYFCDETGRNVSSFASARPAHSSAEMLDSLVLSNVILACHSAMVRRSALDAVGPPYFDTELRGTEDEDLWIRLAASGSIFTYLDVPTCKYRVHDGNASRYEPASPVYLHRQESVKRSRFKILAADFFTHLRPSTREQFFYKLLLFQLQGDEAARQEALNSGRFAELPSATRARSLYHLAVRNFTQEGSPDLGRRRFDEAVRLVPGDPKYRSVLWLSHRNQWLLKGLMGLRRWLNRLGRQGAPTSPVGQGGLRLS